MSAQDSELVARYRRAGFIIVGKTNTREFASKPTTEPELFGKTGNPWNPAYSSGGSAAVVAAGMAAVMVLFWLGATHYVWNRARRVFWPEDAGQF